MCTLVNRVVVVRVRVLLPVLLPPYPLFTTAVSNPDVSESDGYRLLRFIYSLPWLLSSCSCQKISAFRKIALSLLQNISEEQVYNYAQNVVATNHLHQTCTCIVKKTLHDTVPI